MHEHASQIQAMFLGIGIPTVSTIASRISTRQVCRIEHDGVGNARIINPREPIIVKCVKGMYASGFHHFYVGWSD